MVACHVGACKNGPERPERPIASARLSASAAASPALSAKLPPRYLLTAHELGAATRALRRAVGGPVRALEMRVYPHRIVLQAQDPQHPTTVNQWVYQNGKVAEARRVRLEGEGQLDDNLFPLDDVTVDELPQLIEDGVQHVDKKHGRFVYALIRRALPEKRDVRIRVYVRSPVRDGHVDATAGGRLLRRRR